MTTLPDAVDASGGRTMMVGGIRFALRHLRSLAAVPTATGLSDGELLTRFAELRDEAAFTALVERHGAMVLGVCRRVLGHAQDAEDACQATFLVLVRKAGSVRKRASAASWLHGVAVRTAWKLRAGRVRQERRIGILALAAEIACEDPTWREVQAVLDEELQRLPEKYRAPLVLCYLEGVARDEAARRLGLSLNRLRSRLDYGRERLRARLIRRGVALPLALLAGLFGQEAPAAIPPLLVVSTVKAAVLISAGRTFPAGLVPAQVVALTEGMVRTMFLARLKVLSVLVLVVAGLGAGGAAVLRPGPAAQAPARAATAGQEPNAPQKKPVHPVNQSLAGLAKHYALKDGEVLRSFRPPHPEARKTFFRANRPVMTPEFKAWAVKQGLDKAEFDGNLTLLWKDNGLEFGSVIFAPLGAPPSGFSVETLLRTLAGIAPEEIEGDRALRWTLVGGDFVVRDGAPPARIVAALEQVLKQDFKLRIKLTLGEADRKVYVLGGKYQFKPAAGAGTDQDIEVHASALARGLDAPAADPAHRRIGAAYGSGTFPEFVYALGRFVDHRVALGKADGLPAQVSWHANCSWPITPESWEAEHALAPVLKHITEQTGLTVREETQRVRFLRVERKKPDVID